MESAELKGKQLAAALPGRPLTSPAFGLAKAALRLIGAGDLADAIGDLTGLGRVTVEEFTDRAARALSDHQSHEFGVLADAEREWAEVVVARSYRRLAGNQQKDIAREAIVSPHALARLAQSSMPDGDRNEVDRASDDVRSYLTSLSEAVAVLISEWYETDAQSNQVAVTRAVGETLSTVRDLPDRLNEQLQHSFEATVLPELIAILERQEGFRPTPITEADEPPADRTQSVRVELGNDFAPIADEAEFFGLVERAAVAAAEGRAVNVEVTFPFIDEYLALFVDPIARADARQSRCARSARLSRTLSALFSKRVHDWWGYEMNGVADRVTVARGVLAGPATKGTKLDIWRTDRPHLSAPIWLSQEEVTSMLHFLGFGEMRYLAFGAGWRAASELPHDLILSKVMPAVLAEVTRYESAVDDESEGKVLELQAWHIGEG